MITFDGLEDAFIGLASRFGFDEPVSAYDRDKCIEVLMRDGCTRASAEEHFEFNVIGSSVGEQTPIFIERMTLEDAISLYEDS